MCFIPACHHGMILTDHIRIEDVKMRDNTEISPIGRLSAYTTQCRERSNIVFVVQIPKTTCVWCIAGAEVLWYQYAWNLITSNTYAYDIQSRRVVE